MATAPQALDDDVLASLVRIHGASDATGQGSDHGATKRVAAVGFAQDRSCSGAKHGRRDALLIKLVLRLRKALTRGKAITRESLATFIEGLDLPEAAKASLLALSPGSYTGLATELARKLEE